MLSEPETDRIRETLDRSHTFELLDILLAEGTDGDTATGVERLIRCLEDVRTVEPLLALIENTEEPVFKRERALSVLIDASVYVADFATRQRWFADGDPIQVELALACSDRRDGANISAVLQTPGHSLRIAATASLAFGFEEPEWQQRKVALLRDGDPAVRAAAALVLLWDEPVIAEAALIEATNDADDDVACDAIDTLRYYRSAAALEALLRIRSESASLRRFDMASKSLADLADGMADEVSGVPIGNRHVDRVRDLLQNFAEQVATSNASVDYVSPEIDHVRSVELTTGSLAAQLDANSTATAGWSPRTENAASWSLLRSQLADPNGQWEPKYANLRLLDCDSIPLSDRAEAATYLRQHPDPMVRALSCAALVRLGAINDLVALLDDPIPHVAKSARYSLRDVDANSEIAELVLAPVRSSALAGTQASEAIETWARHRRALVGDEVIGELLVLANDRRETVRVSAIEELVAIDAPVGAQMIRFLHEPPLVTWAVHTTIISGRRHLGLTDMQVLEAIEPWLDVDDLWLQTALSRLQPQA
jgi:hypothetical protein